MMIQELPQSDRPRERLMQHGSDRLSTAELIAVILGSGTKGTPVLALAQQIVAHFGTLEKLADASIAELCQIHGMGRAKAIQLLAAIGLGKKLARQPADERIDVSSPQQVYQLLRDELIHEQQEHFIVVLCDSKNKLLCHEIIAVGSLNETLVYPREVFCPAIRHRAAAVVLAHNHPSGDPTPSEGDRLVSETLVAAGNLIGIPVRDHIIIAKKGYRSMRQDGKVRFAG